MENFLVDFDVFLWWGNTITLTRSFLFTSFPHYRPWHLPKIIGQKDKSNYLGDSVRATNKIIGQKDKSNYLGDSVRATNKKLDYVYLHLCCVAADTLFTVNCCW